MSDFIVVIPEGWTELDWQTITNSTSLGYSYTMDLIGSQSWSVIDEILKAAGVLQPDQNVQEAKLIDDAFFLVRLG